MHARLLRRSAQLLDRIETYQPTCREELEEIADHYARRRVDGAAIGVRAMARFADALRRAGGQFLPMRSYATFPSADVPDPLPSRIEGEDLASLVVHCRGRISAIGQDFRFIAVSRDEAAAHGMRPSQVLGSHLPELFNCGGAPARERRALALALSGRPPSQSRGDREDWHVRHSGVTDSAGNLYAVIRHVGPLAPAQTSPGTT